MRPFDGSIWTAVVGRTPFSEVKTVDIRQEKKLQSYRRVQAWCAANPGLVPPPVAPPDTWTPLTRQSDVVNGIVRDLGGAAAAQGVQVARIKLDATDEAQLRRTLRAEMHAVTQAAQALRKRVPGIGSLKMPSAQVTVETLLKSGDALVTLSSTYEPVLVEHGLDADFIAQLRTAIATLRASVDGRGTARVEMVTAGKQLDTDFEIAHETVKLMDAALTKALRNDPALLAGWRNAKRITAKGVQQALAAPISPASVQVPAVTPAPGAMAA